MRITEEVFQKNYTATLPELNWTQAVLQIRDVYPGSRILIFTHPRSRIPEPKTATKERGEKISCHTFFVAINLTEL
jgi:hypothetical protein